VTDLRRGDDHDPEEDLRGLLPVARLVSDALKGGGEGPELRSEARLMAAIAQSEEPRSFAPRRSRALPAFAVSGWVATVIGFSLFSYQYGLNQSYALQLAQLQQSNMEAMLPRTTEPSIPLPKKNTTRHPSHKKPSHKSPERIATPAKDMPPPVRINELVTSEDLLQDTAMAPTDEIASAEDAQDSLMKVGSQQLSQGQWEEAASSFEQAALQNPDDESALDALHLSATIADRALNNPKKAGEMYRQEMELARRMLERRESDKNASSTEPVKQRLARAMTCVGLMERDPQLIRRAAQETQPDPDATGTTSGN
jgi:hypothetical protein